MKKLSITNTTGIVKRQVKVLQYGEGNFLRGFIDYFIDRLNEETAFDGSIVIVKPTNHGNLDRFKLQHNLYTVILQGLVDNKPYKEIRTITSIHDCINPYNQYELYISYAKSDSLEFIISNTTEAGITYLETDNINMMPPESYPAKLTQFLYKRFEFFSGATDKGLYILPVELIDNNGDELKSCVNRLIKHWNLSTDFYNWVNECCHFINTLVDRIVTGFPVDNSDYYFSKLGYQDMLLVTAEPFGLWVIEGDHLLQQKLCCTNTSLPILFTNNQKPYKERKVRILNGAHTSFALVSFLCGNNYVKESLEDPIIREFIEMTVYSEIIPQLSLSENESTTFANEVFQRFKNPYVNHSLLSISHNSVAKWRTRCLPSLLAYYKKNQKLPQCLVFSLAALIKFYEGKSIDNTLREGDRDGLPYKIIDTSDVLLYFDLNNKSSDNDLVSGYLKNKEFHGMDLTDIPDLLDEVVDYFSQINNVGIRTALCSMLLKEKFNE